jgi:periplasmic protein TonB
MESVVEQHLIIKHTAMTNKEILQSDMLDILFEKRNKAYGAYALRRGYDHRMLLALGSGLAIIFSVVLFNMIGSNSNVPDNPLPGKETITISTIEIPEAPEKPKDPEKPKEKPAAPKVIKQVATVKNTANIKIEPDKVLKTTEMPEVTDLKDNQTGTENIAGEKPGNIVTTTEKPANTGNSEGTGTEKSSDFIINERAPEFPGGEEALARFLSRNLNTPEELEAGQKKAVRIRFTVGSDGSISVLEIVQTGGDKFDKEVLRVCKKMPRWKPAVQNGMHVPVSYVLPVTFIGTEQ